MRRRLFMPLAVVMALTVTVLAAPAGADDGHDRIKVKPGESIQAAIDAAHPGDTIRVAPGTYRESLLITKDDITVRGSKGTVLMPPAQPTLCDPNDPTSSGNGICIVGDVSEPPNGPAVVNRYVKDVTVRGFTIKGFEGFGVVVFGGRDTVLKHITAIDNGEYGLTAFVSTGTTFLDNTASGSGEAGFYVGDSPNADATLRDNEAFDNYFGFFVRNARDGKMVDNKAHDNCAGIVFLGDAPGPVGDFRVDDNRVVHNNKFCPATTGEEAFRAVSGEGIDLFGATDVKIVDNKVRDNVPSGSASVGERIGGGVNVTSGFATPSSDNTVVDNVIKDNKPVDLLWDGKGSDNRFKDNRCVTSDPAELCQHDHGHND